MEGIMADPAATITPGPLPQIVMSGDGFIRLTLAQLRIVPLTHCCSDLDIEGELPHSVAASLATICGFTEWASATWPAISLGWDWRLEAHGGRPHCARIGDARSNVMLIDDDARDCRNGATARCLAEVIDRLDWPGTIIEYLRDHSRWITCQF